MNKKIIICDLDGTVAKMGDRFKHIEKNPKDWDAFYADDFNDEPIFPVIKTIKSLYKSGYTIVFLTGRSELSRQKTESWLKKYFDIGCYLLMRPLNQKGKDVDVKINTLNDFYNMSGYNKDDILCIFEDRSRMVNKYRELGYTVFQVAAGNY
ncbi:MAG: hypothetical protein M0R51_12615 [Clostridia bacterium]|jgi:hypothetical protein|nr:hypothetical protein [Clostridia bacterium]